MQVKISRFRRAAIALGAFGVTIGGMAAPAIAQQNIEEYCRMSAHVICGYDANGQPVWPTFECVDREYQECMELYGPPEN